MSSNLRQITLNLSPETKELLDRLSETVHLTTGELFDRAVLNIACEEPETVLAVILNEIVIFLTAGYLNDGQVQLIYSCLTKVYINALNSPLTKEFGILIYFTDLHSRLRRIIEGKDNQ